MAAYDHVIFNGVLLNKRTAAMLEEVQRRLGYKLTLYQGSYNGGRVGPSAGTHDGGGAVDLAPADWEKKVRALRNVGFAAWHRQASSEWVEHIHAVAIGDKQLAPLAALQVKGYRENRDGLGPWPFGPDNTYHPSPIPTFNYNPHGSNSKWEHGDVYVSKLHAGQKDSDSVRRLQTQLKKLKHFRFSFVPVNGTYGPRTVRAVQRWQKRFTPLADTSGKRLTDGQAKRLLDDNYRLHF